MERSEYFMELLDKLIQPENNYVTLIEFKFFEHEDKNIVFEVYRKFKILEKKSLIASITTNGKENVEFICYAFDMWHEVKDNLLKLAKTLEKGWHSHPTLSEDTDYLG